MKRARGRGGSIGSRSSAVANWLTTPSSGKRCGKHSARWALPVNTARRGRRCAMTRATSARFALATYLVHALARRRSRPARRPARLAASDRYGRLTRESGGHDYQVVRQTRLWRNEKVDVANDLVAHFQDGLAFGHSPDDLLRTFGDPQAAAQLIRRAKRRNRALFWHVGRYGLIALAALVAPTF